MGPTMASTLESPPTQLTYLGARNHIYAVDVFRAFEQFAAQALPEAQRPRIVRSFKMIREVKRDGRWRIGADVAEPAASVEWQAGDEKRIARFEEDGEVITARGPDNPRRVRAIDPGESFAGRAALHPPVDSADLMLGVVQANKALHVHTLEAAGLPHDKIRMIYVEGLPILGETERVEQELVFRSMGQRRVGERTYTLAQVTRTSAAGGEAAPLRICFSC